ILIEKWSQDLLSEIQPGVAAELERAKRAAVPDLLSVIPRAHHEKDFVVCRILRLDRLVHGLRPVNVLLIPETVHEHHRHLERLTGQQTIDRLIAPERVIRRMLGDLLPEPHLIQAATTSELAGGG